MPRLDDPSLPNLVVGLVDIFPAHNESERWAVRPATRRSEETQLEEVEFGRTSSNHAQNETTAWNLPIPSTRILV